MRSSRDRLGNDAAGWDAIARDADFQRLVRTRRRFTIAMLAFAGANLVAYIVLVSWAPDFMASTIAEGLSVGYLISIAEIVLVCALAWLYIRKAGREWDPMLRRIVESAPRRAEARSGERFRREPGVGA
jgi:uncharacterized membrane protein (DUF485 family)